MHYRGGRIGHFLTWVDEPLAPPDTSLESKEDPPVKGIMDGEGDNGDDHNDLGSKDEDRDNAEEKEDHSDEDKEEDKEDEEKDSTLQSSSTRIQEQLVDDLGYSEL